MESIGFETLAALLVLLPGFLAARTVQSLCVRPSQTELDKVVEALLYSFLIYVVFLSAFHRFPLEIISSPLDGGAKSYKPVVRARDLLSLLAIGLALGLSISASITNDLHGKLFRHLRLTQRTTRSSIWSDVFHELSYYAPVQFTDGRKLIGWIKYFSDTPEESSLFLERAAWIDQDGNLTDVPGPGILVTKNLPIESIMFLEAEPDTSNSSH
jgi:Family of unknown function (DUF6338)